MELDSLTEDDFRRILTEPENALTKQYQQLLAVDGIELSFSGDALDEVAHVAEDVNKKLENIGARRLHTVLERLLDDLMFEAPENGPRKVHVTCEEVRASLGALIRSLDKSQKIL